MSEQKKRRTRANPMTPILRDLRVAVGRIEKVRDALKKVELQKASDTASNVVLSIDDLAYTIGEAWGNAAAVRARNEVRAAYIHPVDQPLPTISVEA